MPDQEAQQEPSMEEILASIRRIISEEDEDGAKSDGEADDSDAPEAEAAEETPDDEPVDQDDDDGEDDDVLELTELADEEPAAEPEADVADSSEIDDIMASDETEDEILLEEDDDVDQPTEVATAEPPAAPTPVPDDDTLVSQPQAAMAASSFAALRSPELSGAMQIGGAYTVEGLVREMLRPMLKQWLDIHLPSIVEEAVRDEIARIANQDRKE